MAATAPYTYSFLDTHAAIVGPGGSFSLGAGVGAAEEGVSVEPNGEIDRLMIGADGYPMHSLIPDKSGKVMIRLLKTSPTNQLLSQMVAFQRQSSVNFGQNTITIFNATSGDSITCQQVAFARIPKVDYAKEGGHLEWEFNVGVMDITLGAGVAA